MKAHAFVVSLLAISLASAKPMDWQRNSDPTLQRLVLSLGNHFSPEKVFGESGQEPEAKLRVRSYARNETDILVIESVPDPDSRSGSEFVRSVQLKRLLKDGTIRIVWNVRWPATDRILRMESQAWKIEATESDSLIMPTPENDVPDDKLHPDMS